MPAEASCLLIVLSINIICFTCLLQKITAKGIFLENPANLSALGKKNHFSLCVQVYSRLSNWIFLSFSTDFVTLLPTFTSAVSFQAENFWKENITFTTRVLHDGEIRHISKNYNSSSNGQSKTRVWDYLQSHSSAFSLVKASKNRRHLPFSQSLFFTS